MYVYRYLTSITQVLKDIYFGLDNTFCTYCLFTVEAAYLESDLMMMITAPTWENVSELIGITPVKFSDIDIQNKN
jgi:hypothetical protein